MNKSRIGLAAVIFVCAGVGAGSACTVHSYSSPPPGSSAPPAATPAPTPAPTPTATSDAAPSAAYDPCAGKQCGASCSICDPADKNCVETAVVKQCSVAGKCEATPAQCGTATTPGYAPCAGKKCGERCRMCATGDLKCTESPLVKLCHPDGQCKESTTVDCSKK